MNPALQRAGWLLDLYPDPYDGVTVWLLGEDGVRYHLRQSFPVTFYAAGPRDQLRELWRFLQGQPNPPRLARAQRRDLFQPRPLTVLAVTCPSPLAQVELFREVERAFPALDYYDADLHLALRHAAAHGTFPLARCALQVDRDDRILAWQVLDSPWDLDPAPPPLRVLELEPDSDPARTDPRAVLVRAGKQTVRLPLEPARALLVNLRALLDRHDPDLLLTTAGDVWLLPLLIRLAEETGLPLPLNRAEHRAPARRKERSYFSYGQIVYKGAQVLLFGRWHLDRRNAMLWGDYGLEGALETARVTGLPVQEAARLSPGTGISSMQIRTALSQEILVPWRKQVAENPKTALDLITTDQGGLVYQPILGVHSSVGAIDFISMYPGIMVRCNISPETVPHDVTETTDQPPGLVPQTLAPLLDKRVALKHRLARLPAWDPRRGPDQARSSAHKWLLVTCFGYLGYKNARFGQIEAHEAVTRYGREALLRAKEAAEDLGFAVLQMYVDGLWLQRPDATRPEDFEAVLNAVVQRTGLPVALDGVYRWVAFLPSRSDPRVPVPNRYFGAFQDGSLKVRGLAARRRDTPPFVAALQMELIEIFARAETAERLPACLPEARRCVQRRLAELAAGRVPPADLLVAQRLSRDLARYRTPSPAARAAAQLAGIGKEPRPGQRVRFLHLLGRPDVHAWDLPEPVDPRRIDLARYRDLALRAAREVIEGLGLRLETEEARSFSFRPLAGRPLLAERAMILLPRTKPAPPPEERS